MSSSKKTRRSAERRPELQAQLRSVLAASQAGSAKGGRRPTSEGYQRWTHGFHTYPAGLHPDGAALLLALMPEGSICDPFCGGGTVLVEAMAAGRACVGRDISPIAVRLAGLRCARCEEPQLSAFRSAARRATAEARQARQLPDQERLNVLRSWYEEHVLWELESLRRACMKAPQDIRPLLVGCFSAIVIKTSLRQSDTMARRVTRKRPPGTTAVLFHKKARELARRLTDLRQALPAGTPAPDIAAGDARQLRLPQPVAGIITSPPYPGVYDYLPMQHLRHVWLGLRPEREANKELGSRRAFRGDSRKARARWRQDSLRWLNCAREALQPGGRLALVVGDGRANRRTIGTADPMAELAAQAGLQLLARASRQEGLSEHALLFERS